jgi:hypothetical protein
VSRPGPTPFRVDACGLVRPACRLPRPTEGSSPDPPGGAAEVGSAARPGLIELALTGAQQDARHSASRSVRPPAISPSSATAAAVVSSSGGSYQRRETVFATVMADRADWDKATRAQRQLAVAADAELRRRHPGQYFSPLRSAEPEPATGAQRDDLALTPDQPPAEVDQWITDLAVGHRTFADRLADRESQTVPSEDPDYGDHGPAFPAWTSPGREPILQLPKPEIPPSPQILQRAINRDADREAAD